MRTRLCILLLLIAASSRTASAQEPDTTEPAPPAFPEPAPSEPAPAAPTYSEPPPEPEAKKNPLKELKLALGLRLGYALPFGDFSTDDALADTIAGALPITFDAAVRLKGVELGLYGQLLVGFAGDDLETGCSDCSVFGFRFGAQANYHMLPGKMVDPWIGLGVGIERVAFSESRTVQAVTTSGSIVEIDIDRRTTFDALPELTLQAGVDIGGEPIAIGPFVSISAAQYSSYEIEVDCNDFRCAQTTLSSVSGDVPSDEQAWHSWLIVGVRGNYVLF